MFVAGDQRAGQPGRIDVTLFVVVHQTTEGCRRRAAQISKLERATHSGVSGTGKGRRKQATALDKEDPFAVALANRLPPSPSRLIPRLVGCSLVELQTGGIEGRLTPGAWLAKFVVPRKHACSSFQDRRIALSTDARMLSLQHTSRPGFHLMMRTS